MGVLRLCAQTAPLLGNLLFTALFAFTFIAVPVSARAAAAPACSGTAGIVVSNTAAAIYSVGTSSGSITRNSNTITVTTVALRTPSTTEFLKYAPQMSGETLVKVAPGAFRPGSDPSIPFVVLPAPVPAGSSTPLDLTKPVPLVSATIFHVGEPVFVRVTDPDQNVDPSVSDTVTTTITDRLTDDIEIIRLTETGPDTGVFVGYIQSTGNTPLPQYNGLLPVIVDSSISATYKDTCDATDSSAAAALVDPYGIVFDSSTGNPVDGAIVSLINATTGSPATVYGDDGSSAFPATVTTGAVFVVNGTTYTFPPGGFRFPFVSPGDYKFKVIPPPGYSVPSRVPDATLQALPGGPFFLVTPGSRLEQFTINYGPAIHIDIPIDPHTAALWIQKRAGKSRAAPGDFVPYQIDLQNTDELATAPGVSIADSLPPGLRYRQGSTMLNGVAAPDPVISSDGRTLTFSIGDLPPTGTVTVRYVVEVSAGIRPGIATNQASATSTSGIRSNVATASVNIRSDFMQTQSIIMGEMILGPCEAPLDKSKIDLSGIRLFLEDGTYVVTDKKGMYHFEGVKPGTRVVQLDLDSIPPNYEILACGENDRFAKRSYSQFVDIQGGVLWRADFYLGLKPKVTGNVGLELQSSLKKGEPVTSGSDTVEYSVPIQIGAVPVRNLRLTIMLPDGMTYRQGTSSLDKNSLPDMPGMDSVFTYRLGDYPENWRGVVRFNATVPLAGAPGKLVTKALLTFNTPEKDNVRTPVVDNALERKSIEKLQPVPEDLSREETLDSGSPVQADKGKEKMLRQVKTVKRTAMPEFVLHPHFPTFGADLSEDDKQTIDNLAQQFAGLDIEEITVTGHTDHVRIAPRSRHIYADNIALSKARAASVGKYLAGILNMPLSKFNLIGKGQTEPVASNRTSEGRALNRRVSVKILTVKTEETFHAEEVENPENNGLNRIEAEPEQPEPVTAEQETRAPEAVIMNEIMNDKDRSGMKSVPTVGLRPGEKWIASKADRDADVMEMPDYNAAWLKKASPGLAWLWPLDGYNPPFPAVNVAIKHDPRNTLKLFLNGAETDPLSFDGTLKRDDQTLAVSNWNGVHITEGDNIFEAVEFDESKTELSRVKQIVHYSTPPVKAELVPGKSHLIADGKNPPVIAVLLTDKDGHPARGGTTGEYTLDPPYTALHPLDEPGEVLLGEKSTKRLKFRIGNDGIARIELQPTTKTDEPVRIRLIGGTQEIQTRLTPDYRDWILVGIAEGTAGYNTVSGHMENLKSSGVDENFYDKERVAFYSKGTIKGGWLLTMAYDSARQRTGASGNALFQTVDPNSYYTIYGDATAQGYEAPSQRKLYVKIQREQFYAMFGDFDTGLTITELSRYSRRINGIKSEFRTNEYEISAFGAETAQAFVKDELRGDGTSGLYRLTRSGIVANSEIITIEARDRFHSEVIRDSRQLSRFIDYSIDYDSGTIFFKSPVPSKDDQLNPVYIVVDYEINNTGTEALTYGGRAGTTVLDGRLKAGATYVHEGQVNGQSNLYGADSTLQLGGGTKARAEIATTDTGMGAVKTSGNAYLAEITHTDKKMDGKLYYREQESGFGLGQQNGSETGTRKLGAEGAYRLDGQATVGGQGYRQYNLATGAVRDFVEGTATYSAKEYSSRAGLRYANDNLADGSNETSVQGTAGASWITLEKRLTLRADHEQSLFNNNNNSDFPTRTTVGTDYKITKDTVIFAQGELASGANDDSITTRAGVKSTTWSGGSLSTAVVNDSKENSARTFANVGLTQAMQLTPYWAVDGGLDHNRTIRKKSGYQFNSSVPVTSGGEDFTAVTFGANFTAKRLSWSNRAEYRNSDSEDKWGVFSGLLNEQGHDWGWTTRLKVFHTQSAGGNSKTDAELRLGLAYRPPATKWILLNRLDLVDSDERTAATSIKGRRVINNLNANYKPDRKTQLSLQYGAKYVLEKIDVKDYSGYMDLIGIEGRYDLTSEWDIGLRSSMLHSWSTRQIDYSFGPSVGFNVMENAWLSLGYNLLGFSDKDFSAANYTSQGPFVQFRFKFDQNSVRNGLKVLHH